MIPLTLFTDQLGKRITVELDDGSQHTGVLNAVANGRIYLWPCDTPARSDFARCDIFKLYGQSHTGSATRP